MSHVDAAVAHFLALQLSYVFSVTPLPGDGPARLRFVFSKPTPTAPEPEITVRMDAEVLPADGPLARYALLFEGQKYRRVIAVGGDNDGDTPRFSEQHLDKVYEQKRALRQTALWA